jgi:hypothetical protein
MISMFFEIRQKSKEKRMSAYEQLIEVLKQETKDGLLLADLLLNRVRSPAILMNDKAIILLCNKQVIEFLRDSGRQFLTINGKSIYKVFPVFMSEIEPFNNFLFDPTNTKKTMFYSGFIIGNFLYDVKITKMPVVINDRIQYVYLFYLFSNKTSIPHFSLRENEYDTYDTVDPDSE